MSNRQLRETLRAIADLASRAASELDTDGGGAVIGNGHAHGGMGEAPSCSIRSLPRRLIGPAAQTAARINPLNAPVPGNFRRMSVDGVWNPAAISVITSKYWGPAPRRLTVTFLESTPPDLRSRILAHMNAWTRTGCITFVETKGTGDVRISRNGDGYWSYLGIDILHIPKSMPTMNLQGFTMSTPDSEFHRVVRHETGHTLGFPHEHMRADLVARIDPEKAYAYFLEDQGWDRDTVNEQVLKPLSEKSLMGTPVDQTSIMCYQLPGRITRDGLPIVGGADINATDFSFNGKIYPKPASSQHDASFHGARPHAHGHDAHDWDPAMDVVAPAY